MACCHTNQAKSQGECAVHSTSCLPTNGDATLGKPMNDIIPMSLVDESAPPEDVNDDLNFSFIQVNDDIDEAEGDDSDEEGEWDDGNETDEQGEDIYL